MASRKLVFPWPLPPMITSPAAGNSKSRDARFRKLRTVSCVRWSDRGASWSAMPRGILAAGILTTFLAGTRLGRKQRELASIRGSSPIRHVVLEARARQARCARGAPLVIQRSITHGDGERGGPSLDCERTLRVHAMEPSGGAPCSCSIMKRVIYLSARNLRASRRPAFVPVRDATGRVCYMHRKRSFTPDSVPSSVRLVECNAFGAIASGRSRAGGVRWNRGD